MPHTKAASLQQGEFHSFAETDCRGVFFFYDLDVGASEFASFVMREQVDDIVLTDLLVDAPHVVVQESQELGELLFNLGFPLALIDTARETHQGELAMRFKSGFLVVAVIENHEQQIHRIRGDFNLVGDGHVGGVGCE